MKVSDKFGIDDLDVICKIFLSADFAILIDKNPYLNYMATLTAAEKCYSFNC